MADRSSEVRARRDLREGRRPRSESGCVRDEFRDGRLAIRLERSDAKNRLSAAMALQLIGLIEAAEDDEAVRLVTIEGVGSDFCAGFERDVDWRLVESFARLTKPTVALVRGEASDEGFELALAADLRIAGPRARFALTAPARGEIPRFGATQRLPRLIGVSAALKTLLAGEAIGGADALRLGLATYAARSERAFTRTAAQVVRAILSRAPLAAGFAKEAVLKGYDMTLEQGIRLEEDLYALLQTTADRAEGVRAFLERRKPLFKGA